MSGADIWKNAPSTIRNAKTHQVQPEATHTEMTSKAASVSVPPHQTRTPLQQGHSSQVNQQIIAPFEAQQTHRPHPLNQKLDDNTIATYTSTASRTLNSSFPTNRFSELEAAVAANQKGMKVMNDQVVTNNGNKNTRHHVIVS